MAHSDHGIVKNENGEEQAKDRQRAQAVHTTDPEKSVSREATGNPKSDESAGRDQKGSALTCRPTSIGPEPVRPRRSRTHCSSA
jgi:hypothetical protein